MSQFGVFKSVIISLNLIAKRVAFIVVKWWYILNQSKDC